MIKLFEYTDISKQGQNPLNILKETHNAYENIILDYKNGHYKLGEFYLNIEPTGVIPDILVCTKTQELQLVDYGAIIKEEYKFLGTPDVTIQNLIKLNKVELRRFEINQRQNIVDIQIETADAEAQPYVYDLFHAWKKEIEDFVQFATSDWRNEIQNGGCPISNMPESLWLEIKTELLTLDI